jgi:hypothetical protein
MPTMKTRVGKKKKKKEKRPESLTQKLNEMKPAHSC